MTKETRWLLPITLVALIPRLALFGFESYDWKLYFSPYLAALNADPFDAFRTGLGNSSAAFASFLLLLSFLPDSCEMLGAKSVFFAFEAGGALVGASICAALGLPRTVAFLVYALMLFSPAVILNGSMWGQSDSIYTFFLLLFVRLTLSIESSDAGRSSLARAAACASFGAAFAFKLQSGIMILPLLVLVVRRRFRASELALVPAAYLVSLVPAALLGRSPVTLAATYYNQAMKHRLLTVDAPTIYALLPGVPFDPYYLAGVAATAAVGLLVTARIVMSGLPYRGANVLQISLVSCLALGYLLPGMHERYFYPADLLSILVAASVPSLWPLALATTTISFLGYLPYLFGYYAVKRWMLAAAMGIVTVIVLVDLLQRCEAEGDRG